MLDKGNNNYFAEQKRDIKHHKEADQQKNSLLELPKGHITNPPEDTVQTEAAKNYNALMKIVKEHKGFINTENNPESSGNSNLEESFQEILKRQLEGYRPRGYQEFSRSKEIEPESYQEILKRQLGKPDASKGLTNTDLYPLNTNNDENIQQRIPADSENSLIKNKKREDGQIDHNTNTMKPIIEDSLNNALEYMKTFETNGTENNDIIYTSDKWAKKSELSSTSMPIENFQPNISMPPVDYSQEPGAHDSSQITQYYNDIDQRKETELIVKNIKDAFKNASFDYKEIVKARHSISTDGHVTEALRVFSYFMKDKCTSGRKPEQRDISERKPLKALATIIDFSDNHPNNININTFKNDIVKPIIENYMSLEAFKNTFLLP